MASVSASPTLVPGSVCLHRDDDERPLPAGAAGLAVGARIAVLPEVQRPDRRGRCDGARNERRRLLGAALGSRDLLGRDPLLRGGADGDHFLGVGERALHLVIEHGGGHIGARDHGAVLLQILGAAAHPQEALVEHDDVEGAAAPGLVLALDGEHGGVARLAHLRLGRDGGRLDRRTVGDDLLADLDGAVGRRRAGRGDEHGDAGIAS